MLTNGRGRAVAAAFALLALVPGCTKSPTRPLATDVRLSVTVQPPVGGPSNPISIDIRAVNAGETQIWHCEGCVCGNGTGLTVLAPNGAPVALNDPRRAQCLSFSSAPLPPGGVLGNGGPFTGVLYVMDSPIDPTPTYAALPGTYTVVASFSYAMSPMSALSAPIGITRLATFVWKP